MRDRHAFRPTLGGGLELEPRVVLSRVGLVQAGAVPRKPVGLAAKLDQAFGSFRTEYFAARDAYLKSGAAAGQAFMSFTTQRVNVLAQDISAIFLHINGGTSRIKGKPPQLQVLIQSRILNNSGPAGLLYSLNVQALPLPGTKEPALSLYTATAESAISAARAATENSIRYIATGAFGLKHASR